MSTCAVSVPSKARNRSLAFSHWSSGLFHRSKLTVVNLIDYFSVKTIGQIRRKKLANLVPSTLFEFLLLPSSWARFYLWLNKSPWARPNIFLSSLLLPSLFFISVSVCSFLLCTPPCFWSGIIHLVTPLVVQAALQAAWQQGCPVLAVQENPAMSCGRINLWSRFNYKKWYLQPPGLASVYNYQSYTHSH